LGRTDDMVVVRGVNVYPTAVEELVRACGGVAEYRAEISQKGALVELALQIEPSADCADPAALVRRLEASFTNALALRVPIVLVRTLGLATRQTQTWQREIKGRAFVNFGFGPDFAAVFADDALDGGQADAGAFEVLRAMEALKHAEQFVGVAHVEPDAVVAHK